MNIRQLYIGFIFVFALALFYQYSSEQRAVSAEREVVLMKAEAAKQLDVSGNDFIYLENDLLRLVIKTSDGSIVEARSKEHLVQKVEGSLGVRIFGSDALNGFKYYFKSGFTGSQKNYNFEKYISNGVLLISDDGLATKEIVFSDLPYEVLITDSSPEGANGKPYASLYRSDSRSLDMNFDFSSGGMINRSSYEAYVISTSQDPYEAERLRKVEAPLSVTSSGGWVGFTQKYFLAVLLGSNDFIYNYHVDGNNKGGLYKMGYVVQPDDFSSSAVTGHTHKLFVGPKVRKDLVLRANNLEQTIEMGWFWFISQPMIWLLDKIHGVVGSWGWSVVIITLMLKLVLWPVTGAGFKSMAGLRRVQPEMKEIQDRYANDRQKLGVEMMSLYKKHGVNPMGGCLPIFAQMPFFIAFFFGLREMVELRHASFFWLSDLSAPDPLFILPVMFGLIMVFTQKLNPQPPNMDPTQAQVMKAMPVMISIFFVIFPSSLALYSVFNSGMSLIQQKYLYAKFGGNG